MDVVLREGLLEGCAVVATAPSRAALTDRLTALGAAVHPLTADPADEPGTDAAVAAIGRVDVLLVDAAAAFAAADPAAGEDVPLRLALDAAWAACRAVATAAWIPAAAPGKVALVAPSPDAGLHAEAARAALENLARTLSIEWSRHGVRTTAITPGARTRADDVATLVAYLASPAGDYFSGARLDLPH